jgi:hypothetical protein
MPMSTNRNQCAGAVSAVRRGLVMMIAVLGVTDAAVAQTKVEESIVGRSAPRTNAYAVSKSGVHYAVLTPKGSRFAIVVDGVEGPEFDELLAPQGAALGGDTSNVPTSVVFSADGSRHAYLARIGNEYILVVDGKELYRAELLPSRTNLSYAPLQFSPGGKHVYFVDLKPGPDRNARAQLVMDGKPGPTTGNQAMTPVFSPDESRYAYNAVKINGRIGGGSDQLLTVVDGKELPFNGFDPAFTADNKLLTHLKAGAPSIVIVPENVSTGSRTRDTSGPTNVERERMRTTIGAAPVGSRWAGVRQPAKPGDPSVLFLDGKEVPDALNPEEVIFSSDGKRYMAICRNNTTRARFIVLDGKKGPDYQTIAAGLTRFSPDSSRAIYVGNTAGKNFVVVDGQPSEGYVQLTGSTANRIVVSQKGGRYGYVAGDGSGVNQILIIDGKPVALDGKSVVPDTLSFSQDGSRYAFVAGQRLPGSISRSMVLVVNGQDMAGVTLGEFVIPNAAEVQAWWVEQWGLPAKYYVFSPDGKHIVYTGIRASDKRSAVFVDGKALFVATAGPATSFPTWTPDSKHLFWTSLERSAERPQPYPRVFLDGKATTARIFDFEQPTTYGLWQVGADGALRLVVFEGPVAKRYRITPGNDTNIDVVLAAAK